VGPQDALILILYVMQQAEDEGIGELTEKEIHDRIQALSDEDKQNAIARYKEWYLA